MLIQRFFFFGFFFFLLVSVFSCEKKKDKVVKIGSKMRSTGFSLNIQNIPFYTKSFATMTANSTFSLESYKVPVSRINLGNNTGSGVSGLSPNIYKCPFVTDAECLIDLTEDISVDDLLKNNEATEFKLDEEKTYNAVLVEFCHETENSFSALIKGSVILGTTTYYTNAISGLSATGPSEEISVPIGGTGCGSTTDLTTSLTVTPAEEGKATQINIILYADPNGAVFATDQKTLANSSCLGEETLAICSDAVTVFSTISQLIPTVERYQLKTTGDYSDLVLTILFDESDLPFGASLLGLYTNTNETKSLHSGLAAATPSKNTDDTITLKYSNSDLITNFVRGAHDNTVDQATDTIPLNFSAVKLKK